MGIQPIYHIELGTNDKGKRFDTAAIGQTGGLMVILVRRKTDVQSMRRCLMLKNIADFNRSCSSSFSERNTFGSYIANTY